jgi:hypothetical protein
MFNCKRFGASAFARAHIVAASILASAMGCAPSHAGSIQQPGLMAGLPEGWAPEPGLYGVMALNSGADEKFNSTVGVPAFLNFSTPLEVAGARVQLKTVPLVVANVNMQGLHRIGTYNSYVGTWFSWFLGHGFNVAIGEGAWISTGSPLTRALGTDFTAFQQNLAITYLRDNWNITLNSFYATGHTNPFASSPQTLNFDLTAIKRDGRAEWGFIAFSEVDLDKPAVGYMNRQSSVAIGALYGYLIGNQISAQIKLSHTFYAKNTARDTRLGIQFIIPIYTPAAPAPSNSAEALAAR